MLAKNEDTKRRKFLAINAVNIKQAIFDNKKLTPKAKMTAFKAYIEPIFPYNYKIWTITSYQAENTISAFQQSLLRTYMLNVKWTKRKMYIEQQQL